jgi:hypothetical protein
MVRFSWRLKKGNDELGILEWWKNGTMGWKQEF